VVLLTQLRACVPREEGDENGDVFLPAFTHTVYACSMQDGKRLSRLTGVLELSLSLAFFFLLCFALFLYSVFSCMPLNPCVVPGAVRFCSTLVELWSSRFIALYSVWSNQELLVPGFKISAKFGNFGGGRKKTPKFCNALIHVMYNSRLAFFY
jgi:hypothetical protein